eukprot:TRINITY_DN3350_c0_g1_i1.p1 TRINITY_DN3350_c0_g1~~TRINITY_DN3350_c0_g1_i1.p1  ORF type:complete len:149 (+),score=14.19 TRINITY_DN3350_c0_g1_i1:41-487(+)
MELCKWLLEKRFPRVQQLTTEALAECKDAIIFDVRPPSEFEISHTDGAHRVDMNDAAKAAVILQTQDYQPGRPVVAYCSVGYRSSVLAQSLVDSGAVHADDVYNLNGSLFQWATEDRPMIDGRGETAIKVHPYNWLFGMLLPAEKRAV